MTGVIREGTGTQGIAAATAAPSGDRIAFFGRWTLTIKYSALAVLLVVAVVAVAACRNGDPPLDEAWITAPTVGPWWQEAPPPERPVGSATQEPVVVATSVVVFEVRPLGSGTSTDENDDEAPSLTQTPVP